MHSLQKDLMSTMIVPVDRALFRLDERLFIDSPVSQSIELATHSVIIGFPEDLAGAFVVAIVHRRSNRLKLQSPLTEHPRTCRVPYRPSQ